MSYIYGTISTQKKPDLAHLEILRADLARYPSDQHFTYQYNAITGGLYAYRLRKAPFPIETPIIDEETGISVLASARLDYRKDLLTKLSIDQTEEKKISDNELILKAYLKWGEKCVDYLEGDFSFLIQNPSLGYVWGARDPIGYKPFFFNVTQSNVYFSSHIYGLARLPFVSLKPSDDFWSNRFLSTRQNQLSTPFEEINQIPVGHTIKIDDGRITTQKYFHWSKIPIQKKHSRKDYATELTKLLEDAVETRLYDDYPVGAYFSGGLDSSAVVAIAHSMLENQSLPQRLVTTTSVHPKPVNTKFDDEREWVNRFKAHFPNTEINCYSFDDEPKYRPEDAELFIRINFRRHSASFVEDLMNGKLISEGCRTMLTGLKGDNFISRGHFAPYSEILKKGKLWTFMNAIIGNARFLDLHPLSLLRTIVRYNLPKKTLKKNELLGSDLLNPEWVADNIGRKTRHFRDEHKWRLTDMNYDIHRFLPDFEGSKGYYEDLSFSRDQVLVRLNPLSDPRLINFTLQLPAEEFVKDGLDRSIMRRALKSHLPETLRLRNTKGSFLVNERDIFLKFFKNWIEYNDLIELIEDTPLQPYLAVDKIKERLEIYKNNTFNAKSEFDRNETFLLNLFGYLFYFREIDRSKNTYYGQQD